MSEKVIINVETDKETVDQLIYTVRDYSHLVDGPPPLNLRKLLKDIEEGVERKCVYQVFVDEDGEPYDDWKSSCGTVYTSDDDYMQPGESDCLYCQKCGGKIEAIKEKVVDDE